MKSLKALRGSTIMYRNHEFRPQAHTTCDATARSNFEILADLDLPDLDLRQMPMFVTSNPRRVGE